MSVSSNTIQNQNQPNGYFFPNLPHLPLFHLSLSPNPNTQTLSLFLSLPLSLLQWSILCSRRARSWERIKIRLSLLQRRTDLKAASRSSRKRTLRRPIPIRYPTLPFLQPSVPVNCLRRLPNWSRRSLRGLRRTWRSLIWTMLPIMEETSVVLILEFRCLI